MSHDQRVKVAIIQNDIFVGFYTVAVCRCLDLKMSLRAELTTLNALALTIDLQKNLNPVLKRSGSAGDFLRPNFKLSSLEFLSATQPFIFYILFLSHDYCFISFPISKHRYKLK